MENIPQKIEPLHFQDFHSMENENVRIFHAIH